MYPTTVIGILFAIYVLLVLTAFGWFGYAVTHPRRIEVKFRISLVSWIVFLSILAVAFHIITYVKLPWVHWEIISRHIVPEKEITINIANYQFQLPENPIQIKVNKPVKFTILSSDVTYGFGIFRTDGTIVFQIQVVPQYKNEIMWTFEKTGSYTIRSTEYSGPEHSTMILRDSIIVS